MRHSGGTDLHGTQSRATASGTQPELLQTLPWEKAPQAIWSDVDKPGLWQKLMKAVEDLIFEEAPEEQPISVSQITRGSFRLPITPHLDAQLQPAQQPVQPSIFQYGAMGQLRPHQKAIQPYW